MAEFEGARNTVIASAIGLAAGFLAVLVAVILLLILGMGLSDMALSESKPIGFFLQLVPNLCLACILGFSVWLQTWTRRLNYSWLGCTFAALAGALIASVLGTMLSWILEKFTSSPLILGLPFLLASDGVGGAKWIAPATSAIPSGAAGGDLAGTYPNPTVANLGAISGANLTNLNGSSVSTGTVPAGRLPIAGTTAGTRGAVYADNTSVFVAADGKLSASGGAPSGTAGGDLSGTYPNPSLVLPLSKTASSASALLSLTNSGSGATTSLSVNNTLSASPALMLQSNGGGYALSVDHSGSNSAGYFRISNTSSTAHALEVANSSRGSAGYFENLNAASTSAALRVVNQGTGGAFIATNTGTGRAGRFHISNANNPDEALYVSNFGTGPGFQVDVANPLNSSAAITSTTNGSGRAIVASNSGTAETARFETSNSSNVNACLVAITNGTGDAGFFRATNTSSGADAILAQMDGTGNAILTRHSGASGNHMVFQSGNPVFATVARIDKDGKAYFNGLELNAALTVPTTTRYYSISSADFTTDDISNLTLIRTDSQVSSSGSASNPVLRAGVHLPHGATITGFGAEVTDNDNNTSVTVSLVSSSSSLATLSSSGGVQTLSTTLSSVVDNQNNSYQVRATWGMAGSVVSLGKVTIIYTITTPLP